MAAKGFRLIHLMHLLRRLLPLALAGMPAFCATFGTVVTGSGGASYSDILLDEAHKNVYVVDSSANRIDVYSLQTKAFLSSIKTDTQPVSIAISRDGKTLYATAYTASALDIVDLTKSTLAVTGKISLPASPEGVAVGADGRVLISTVGNSGNNILIVYDPTQPSGKNLSNVAVTPAAPTPPTLPAPSGTAFLSYHSKLIASNDGSLIIGNNITSTSTTSGRVVFVYNTTSATVVRSRIVANLSNVLAVSPDGSRFMAGPALFDTATLAIIAQENTANSPFAFPANANFNTQTVQGGSIYSPDGTNVWAAFNFAPVANPAVAANVSRLLVNDPDNLLIKLGIQLPENLSGRMVMTAAGDTIYALSQSGFMILPISTLSQSPLSQVDSQVEYLTNDQCGVTAQTSQAVANVTNAGKGRLTVSVQSYTLPNTGVTGLGGAGGPGGTIIFNPGGGITIGGGGTTTTTTTTTSGVAPLVSTKLTATGAALTFRYNPSAAKSLGTVAPNDFLIQAPEEVNIAPNLRVFQNNRNSDSNGKILMTQQNISAAETLMDMQLDTTRQRIYVANSGLNQIEVVDMKTQTLMNPIKVGQLPHSMAMSSDGVTMYVANTGGESISIVDLDKMQTVGAVTFPPVPANVAVALAYPTAIAESQAGPQFVMSDGSLWKIDGTTAVPRVLNPQIFGGSATTLVRTVSGGNPSQFSLAATPNGEYVLLVTGAGNAYLYDASVDDFTKVEQIFTTPLTGFIGPIAAGPKGGYFVANGTLLNLALTTIAGPPGSSSSTTVTGPGLPTTTSSSTARPVSEVAAISATQYALFTQAVLSSTAATASDAGQVQLVDATTGNVTKTFSVLEGPASTVTGTGRATIPPRTMVVDPSLTYAYAVTTSGISVIPLTSPPAANTPKVASNGVVNLASYQTAVAPGSLISIFGSNLGTSASFGTTPLPTVLGGTCVTLNNVAIPLELTSSGQINAQIPVTLAAGKYPLVVRSIANLTESPSTTVTVAKYAPAVFVSASGQAAIVKASDGSLVNAKNPATRDEDLIIFGTGLGTTTGGTVTTGVPAPSSPLAVTGQVQVFFGNPTYSQSPMIVEWSGLVPGLIGVNQINVRVPGTHMNGDTLPVTIKIGGISSPASGPVVPTVALN
jgi:uncharacterized protein (TIGR03437 family)